MILGKRGDPTDRRWLSEVYRYYKATPIGSAFMVQKV